MPASTATAAAAADDEDAQHRRREQGGEETSASVLDPLAGLTESERLALLIRFGAGGGSKGGGMCATMSHGHSFQSSIFRLPAKCAGCHELVWGPFTRGCTCLTCSVTVHRSCTGVAAMPRCPTKGVFDAFCRSELGLPPLLPAAAASPTKSATGTATGSTSPSEAAGSGNEDEAAKTSGGAPLSSSTPEVIGTGGALGERATTTGGVGGDLEEWAKVDGASGHSISPATEAAVPSPQKHRQQQQQQQQQPASASGAVQDLGSSFSWSPLGLSERKRPAVSEDTSEARELDNRPPSREARDSGPSSSRTTSPETSQEASDPSQSAPTTANNAVTTTTATATATAAAAASSSTCNNVGIRGVTKMSVAGGVVGALFGGPVGAVVGLKLGAVLGAGRSVQQGLWQRIEKNRREAGAEGIGLPKGAGAAATAAAPAAASAAEEEAARKPRDVWARIARQVEGEQQPAIWYVLGLRLGARLRFFDLVMVLCEPSKLIRTIGGNDRQHCCAHVSSIYLRSYCLYD